MLPEDLMTSRLYPLAALSMALGVVCGAFGAHALKDAVAPPDLIIWEKAVHYQLIHGLAALGVLATPDTLVNCKRRTLVAALFLLGTIIFSGSLYLLVLANQRWLGMITPLGGSCFIGAWMLLSISAITTSKQSLARSSKS
jgi:uncharacterized membrane protein YgdD (TMEM256/DUF423 family)